jgi:hypothetical protein
MKKLVFPVLFTLSSVFASAQTKINDIVFPDTYTTGKDKLVLNGGGTREKYWMDMYVAALYLTAKSKDAANIVEANASMAIKINIVSSLITSSRMREAVNEGFAKSTGGNACIYKDKIAQFEKAFAEPIKVGDVFDIVYTAETISIYKNNILKGEIIGGMDFKKAVFAIWLGIDPADSDLKDGMLGQTD